VSHAANSYVKKLKQSPTGEAISVQEKAVLWYLADCHSEESGGIAWPSVKTLSEYCHLSERQIRRIVGELERKVIIGRKGHLRENGSCRSNDYYFLPLGEGATVPKRPTKPAKLLLKTGGKVNKSGGKRVEKGVEVVPPTLSPTTGYPGHQRQGDPDTHDSTPLTPVTALESALETSLESPGEYPAPPCPPLGGDDGDGGEGAEEHSTSKAKTARASFSEPGLLPVVADSVSVARAGMAIIDALLPPPPGKWEAFKAELRTQLQRLPEKLRENAMDVFRDAIERTDLIGDQCEGDTLEPTWTICSPDPGRTQQGLLMLKANVKSALWKSAKGHVNIRVFGGEA
jgi:Helix-turn-helix domain